MYDPTLALTIQTMSAKLLVHLVESIFNAHRNTTDNDQKEKGRDILLNIMSAFVTKVKSLSQLIGILEQRDAGDKKQSAQLNPSTTATEDEEKSSTAEEGTTGASNATSATEDVKEEEEDTSTDPNAKFLPFSPYKRSESLTESVNNCRLMVKTLILGLKNVIYVLLAFDQVQTQRKQADEETKLFTSLFKHGLKCFPVYSIGPALVSTTDEKENLDAFASLFTALNQRTFEEIFKQQLPYLYEQILANQNYLTIPTHFLASVQVAHYFSDLLLKFLIDRME
jgi:transformation/transcription domain-associated protein